MKLRISGIVPESMVDGPGVRYAVFVQGCEHGCPGCHNPQTHPQGGGEEREVADLIAEMQKPLIRGLTITGGEPFLQAQASALLARSARALGYGVWIYTGCTWEELIARGRDDERALLEAADVLVDGPFIQAERTLTLPFRGSRNQRLIDVSASLESCAVVLLP